MVGFLGSANKSMLSEFSMKQTALPWQPYLDKNMLISSVQGRETFFASTIAFSGLANSNMISEFFREQLNDIDMAIKFRQKNQNCNN